MTAAAPGPRRPAPDASESDRLAAQVTGPGDHVGMTALWRLTMGLELWWFVAVGERGDESPAAVTIDGREMVPAFTSAQRARHYAVEQGLVGPADVLRAYALPPAQVVAAAEDYRRAGVSGLMFDPHLAGYFIPCEQLPVVWDAVMSTADPGADAAEPPR